MYHCGLRWGGRGRRGSYRLTFWYKQKYTVNYLALYPMVKVTHNTGGRDLDQMRFIFVCSIDELKESL